MLPIHVRYLPSVSFVGAVNVITRVSSEKGSSDSLDNALLDFQ